MITLRDIQLEDHGAIAQVYVDTFAAPPWQEVWTVKAAQAVIREWSALPGFVGLVAENETGVVGAAFGRIEPWRQKPLFHVKELFVSPVAQRSGVGSALLRALEERAANAGCGVLYLHSRITSPAASFYSDQGYRPDERVRLFIKALANPT